MHQGRFGQVQDHQSGHVYFPDGNGDGDHDHAGDENGDAGDDYDGVHERYRRPARSLYDLDVNCGGRNQKDDKVNALLVRLQ